MTYLDRLGRELSAVGIHGRLRDRILAEAADHLTDGEVERFGEPLRSRASSRTSSPLRAAVARHWPRSRRSPARLPSSRRPGC
jgi:hypothetical protein